MLIKILLVIAILIQTVATAYALKLVRATKYNSVWILFIVGFSLLSVERFVQLLMASGQYGAFALLEGTARRAGAAALVGEDVAFGAGTRRTQPRAEGDHRQYDLCDRRGDPFAARDFEQPFAPRAQ